MDNYRFKVNLSGMLDLLSNHLYSSSDVFVRELLQNATDAIASRHKHNPEWNGGEITFQFTGKNILEFNDNGIGLTEDEIHKFLAVIGQSSKRDLITGNICEDYIGRFGIGLLSCFMVTDQIVIHTRSLIGGKSLEWRGNQDGTYAIRELETPCQTGTSIILKIKDTCDEYLDKDSLSYLINYYGFPLPYPIYFIDKNNKQRINNHPQSRSSVSRNDVMLLGEELFGESFLDFIPINSKAGNVSGVAYILPYKVQPNAENLHRIYLKNMLLTEKGDRILPQWAFFVKCFINSSSLRPTASRENFYEDEELEKAKIEIGGCISGYLSELSIKNPEMLKKIISVHSLAIKSLATEDDELFRMFVDYFTFETTFGEMTGLELKNYDGPIVYTVEVEKFKRNAPLFIAQGKLLLNAGYVYEHELIQKFTDNFEKELLPLDENELSCVMDDASLNDEEKFYHLIKAANDALERFDCEAELKCFSPPELPVFYSLDEKAGLIREIFNSKEKSADLFSDMLDSFASEFKEITSAKLYINCNNELIQSLAVITDKSRLKCCIEILYVQSLLIGRFPIKNNELSVFNNNVIDLIKWGLKK